MRGNGRSGTDTETVVAARDGDQDALEALVADALPLVYNIVGRALGAHSDVDDVVQETLLRVVRSLSDLRDPDAFRSWLVAITVRQVRNRDHHRRTAQYSTADLDTADQMPDPASDFADLTILRLGLTDQRREVAEATRWLDGDDRALLAVWWLETTGELDRGELAAGLGLSGRHAAVRVQRMKEQMQVSRMVARVLAAPRECHRLDALVQDWDGTPSPLWRKRFARHIRGCGICGRLCEDLLPMDRLLVGLPMLPVPVSLSGLHFSSLPSDAVRAAAPRTAPHTPQRSGAPRGAHAARRLLPKGPLLGAAAVTSVAVAVAGALIAAHLSGQPSTRTDAAASPVVAAATPSTASPTPRRTESATPTPTAKPKPTPTPKARAKPAAPTATTASAAKKGVGVWKFTGVNQALAASGASWYYTWSTQHSGISGPASTGFVPMVWGAASTDAATLAQAKAQGPYLLGFNEPDMAAQSNMTVDQALSLWPKLMNAGRVLGSPAVAYGGDTPGGWLDRFMSGAKTRGYRVDFIALHWYGGDFTTSAAVSQLKAYLQAVYARYHKPIWLTEYALIDFSQGTRFPTPHQQAAFVTASTRMLAALPYLHRYAWFGLPASDSDPSSGLFRSGPVATEAGRAFEAAH
ncbi:MAG: hypothetical protein QOF44_2175 [Streptomyces sp.]|nr:hypothetical protein [Streptomyces sp.]